MTRIHFFRFCVHVATWTQLLAGNVSAAERAPITLRDVTAQTGITFEHTDGGTGRRYIVETVTAGLALFDYDADGDMDVYLLNGAPLDGAAATTPSPRNALYRNDGNFRFTDVTDRAGVGDTGYGLGVAAADYDNDGAADLFVNNFGANVLYHNNGDGTFDDVTSSTPLAGRAESAGAGACFLDIDADGDLDLYVSNYLDFTYETHVDNQWLGYPVYPGPEHYLPVSDCLYRNEGDGTFSDISVESGIAEHPGRGMGVVAADYDADGDTDILVANDSSPNFVFRNNGRGVFQEVGLETGLAFDLYGSLQGSMGIEAGDFDNDGRLDVHVTSYQGQLAALYHNLGAGMFEDVTLATKAGQSTLPHVTWGNGLVDLDNDGFRDLFIARGHLYDNVDLFSDVTSYRLTNLVLRSEEGRQFRDVSDQCGDGLRASYSSRGAAFDDLDGDGDIDVVVQNSRARPTILRNDTSPGGHWLKIQLIGRKSNREAVGAQVRVQADGRAWIDEVHSGRGYQSDYGRHLLFGLGGIKRIDRLRVRWIGGATEEFEITAIDQAIRLIEGTGRSESP